MTVSAIYRAAPGEAPGELGSNQFTAGSLLILNCSLDGHSGALSYSWSVSGNPSTPDCSSYGCNIDTSSNTSTIVLRKGPLFSYYAGNYTCTVSEAGREAINSSDDLLVTVIGVLKA